ncbi:unnamed protein product [Rotaria sordida]|uniref:Uncharacterized protein n=2 Tax=Rotaria sordida TaxID=392033 RepID=A0A818LK98_9BILA|nr:unnamed protein product [Rotaria sordida]CAF3574257.1 unnamed protein product [Rotaria sordida]
MFINLCTSVDNENGDTFVLKNEIFKELKPGLSSFVNDISKAAEQINNLLKIADQEVSRFKHRSTPLVLRATAGLRLLSETKQKLLLEEMDIAIMNETEEAALDLGGGSTQITYNPSLSNTNLAEKLNLLLKA